MVLVRLDGFVLQENPEDLDKTDAIAMQVLTEIMENSPKEIQLQMQDNITWIKECKIQ